MKTLAVDTALQSCSVALTVNGAAVAVSSLPLKKGHAEALAPMALSVLKSDGIEAKDLDRIVVTSGPGGFTGIRVGLSFARGLAIGSSVAVVGVSTLQALASSSPIDSVSSAAIIAGPRGHAYGALYERTGESIVPPFMALTDEVIAKIDAKDRHPMLVASMQGADVAFPETWNVLDANAQIDIVSLARFGEKFDPEQAPATPLYLRMPDATPAKPSAFAQLLR